MLEEVFLAVWSCFVAGKATLDCLGSPSAHRALLSRGWVLSRALG